MTTTTSTTGRTTKHKPRMEPEMIRCTCEYLIHDGEIVLRVDDPTCLVHVHQAHLTTEATC